MPKTVTYNHQKFKVFESETHGLLFNPMSPICFMPPITHYEIKAAKYDCLEEAYQKYNLNAKRKIGFKTWSQTSEARSLRRELNEFYKNYEKFHSPFYTPEFRELIADAKTNGIQEMTLVKFVSTLTKLRYVSYQAAEDLFLEIYEDVTKLRDFQCVTLDDYKFFELKIEKRWQQKLLEKTYLLNRETGKGEFGSLTVFSNDFCWPSMLGGDVDYKVNDEWISVEWKSCKTRNANMRLGSVEAWSDSATYKKIISDETLRISSIKKEVNPRTVNENILDITRVFGSIDCFLRSLTTDVQNIIQKRLLFVYVLEESTILNVNPENVVPYGVTPEGRFLFTIVPNKRLNVKYD